MKIALAVDHSGFPMKDEVRAVLDELGVEVIDHGAYRQERTDFPDLARKVCASIQSGEADRIVGNSVALGDYFSKRIVSTVLFWEGERYRIVRGVVWVFAKACRN